MIGYKKVQDGESNTYVIEVEVGNKIISCDSDNPKRGKMRTNFVKMTGKAWKVTARKTPPYKKTTKRIKQVPAELYSLHNVARTKYDVNSGMYVVPRNHNKNGELIYKMDAIIRPDKFSDSTNDVCASGIHFFQFFSDAVNY